MQRKSSQVGDYVEMWGRGMAWNLGTLSPYVTLCISASGKASIPETTPALGT